MLGAGFAFESMRRAETGQTGRVFFLAQTFLEFARGLRTEHRIEGDPNVKSNCVCACVGTNRSSRAPAWRRSFSLLAPS